MFITFDGEVAIPRPDEGTPAISGSGRVLRSGAAELVDGDATEGGCGGRGVGDGTLVLGASTAVD